MPQLTHGSASLGVCLDTRETLILAGEKGARKGLEPLMGQKKEYLGMDIKELNEGKGRVRKSHSLLVTSSSL